MLDALLTLDGNILLWLQEFVRNAVLTPILTVYTKLGDVGFLWIVLSLGLLLSKKTRKIGIVSLLALFLGAICTNVVLKHVFERPRPWLTVEGLTHIVEESDPNSFPSGHTTAAFAACVVWFRLLPRKGLRWTALLAAVVMAFSRLYVGVHFPSDVLVGVVVGTLCALLALRLTRSRTGELNR